MTRRRCSSRDVAAEIGTSRQGQLARGSCASPTASTASRMEKRLQLCARRRYATDARARDFSDSHATGTESTLAPTYTRKATPWPRGPRCTSSHLPAPPHRRAVLSRPKSSSGLLGVLVIDAHLRNRDLPRVSGDRFDLILLLLLILKRGSCLTQCYGLNHATERNLSPFILEPLTL
jgi:hypothetical protein